MLRWEVGVLAIGVLVATVPAVAQATDTPVPSIVEELSAATPGIPSDQRTSPPRVPKERAAPQKAYGLLAQLQANDGVPLPGYIGGREFQNRERRLPHGRYREYDVNPKGRGRPRDAERIVIDQKTGKAYYTGDHYRTFIPLN